MQFECIWKYLRGFKAGILCEMMYPRMPASITELDRNIRLQTENKSAENCHRLYFSRYFTLNSPTSRKSYSEFGSSRSEYYTHKAGLYRKGTSELTAQYMESRVYHRKDNFLFPVIYPSPARDETRKTILLRMRCGHTFKVARISCNQELASFRMP